MSKIIVSITPPSLNIVRPRKRLWSTKLKERGVIAKGDWDVNRYHFAEEIAYIAFKQRFIQNKKWEDTIYYKRFQKRLQISGHGRGGTKSFEEFKEKCLFEWDNLYRNIKNYGYKTQKQLGKNASSEVEVGVSRNGEILYIDGRHRLSIAKILGLDEIPVIVNLWHKQYIDWVKGNANIDKITPKTAIQPILNNKTETISNNKEIKSENEAR